jgi:hypothetical protein
MSTFDLRHEILGLLQIRQAGRLPNLLLQHATECRKHDLPRDDQPIQLAELVASEVARAAKLLFGVSEAEAHAIALDALKPCPRRDLGVELIADFLDENQLIADDAPAPARPKKERAW